MKVRESGMPAQSLWETYFEPPVILAKLGLTQQCRDVVEFGSGYATFSIAAARIVDGAVYALDLEPSMIRSGRLRAGREGIANISFIERDFVQDGTGLQDKSVDYAMLFNILHCADPIALLREARRMLRPNGKLGVVHWNYDPLTPRGPPMAIRPRPEDCRRWAAAAGFSCELAIPLPPYHYGFACVLTE